MPSAEWSFNGRVDLPSFMKLHILVDTPQQIWCGRVLEWGYYVGDVLTWTSWGINGYSCVGSKSNAAGYTKDYQIRIHLQHYKRDQYVSLMPRSSHFYRLLLMLYTWNLQFFLHNYTRVSQKSTHPWKSFHLTFGPISFIESKFTWMITDPGLSSAQLM